MQTHLPSRLSGLGATCQMPEGLVDLQGTGRPISNGNYQLPDGSYSPIGTFHGLYCNNGQWFMQGGIPITNENFNGVAIGEGLYNDLVAVNALPSGATLYKPIPSPGFPQGQPYGNPGQVYAESPGGSNTAQLPPLGSALVPAAAGGGVNNYYYSTPGAGSSLGGSISLGGFNVPIWALGLGALALIMVLNK